MSEFVFCAPLVRTIFDFLKKGIEVSKEVDGTDGAAGANNTVPGSKKCSNRQQISHAALAGRCGRETPWALKRDKPRQQDETLPPVTGIKLARGMRRGRWHEK